VHCVSTPGQGWQISRGTVDYLRGRLQADRVLTDRRSGQAGSFHGQAVFAAAEDPAPAGRNSVLSYREDGELRFGGHHGPASRTLLVAGRADGAADVRFADGRPFYALDLRSGYWQAEHPCDCDHYQVTVYVLGPDSFTEHWQARGPAKDYEMTTTLVRIG
jgi:hypothetical protein